MAGDAGLLTVETAHYEHAQRHFTYPDRFLLVRGDEVAGDYGGRSRATAESVGRYGREGAIEPEASAA